MNAATTSPLVLACSPRRGGNSDTAAAIFAAAFAESGGPGPRLLFLRDYPVLPCVACDACAASARQLARQAAAKGRFALPDAPTALTGLPLLGCPLSERDNSAPLLRALATASFVCISAPVYFYHLPAMLKGLLDRLQAFWALREAGLNLFGAPRPCAFILVGARARGQKLFAGSLLSLRYALAQTGLEAGEPLLLNGLDRPGDLAASEEARALTAAYARQAGLDHGRPA